jgi:hypothetical protein
MLVQVRVCSGNLLAAVLTSWAGRAGVACGSSVSGGTSVSDGTSVSSSTGVACASQKR